MLTVNTTTSRPPVRPILQILTTFYLYSGRPKTGLSVNNKQKIIRQAVVKISRGRGVFRAFPGPFTHGGICPPIWGDKCGGTSAGGQSVNERDHEEGHRPCEGDLTLIIMS